MRLPEFTAEASLYRANVAYHAMGAAGLARGTEVLPALGMRCAGCWGHECCCGGFFIPVCLPSGHCACVEP